MTTREERREQIAEARRAQILEAALSVFTRKGYSEATVPDVAREAGVAVGTIYNYYESKRDLLGSIITTYVISQPFLDLLEKSIGSDDREFVVGVMENRLMFGFENIDRFWFVMTEAIRDAEWREYLATRILGPVFEYPRKFLQAKVESGEFREVDVKLAVRAMIGMVMGFLFLYRIEGERSPAGGASARHVAEELADLVLNGFRTRTGNGRRPQ